MSPSMHGVSAAAQVPPCWYQPVRNTGLVWDAETGLVELEKERDAKTCKKCDHDKSTESAGLVELERERDRAMRGGKDIKIKSQMAGATSTQPVCP